MAATDPIQSVTREVYPVYFATGLRTRLRELASVPLSTSYDFLTVYVDLRPLGDEPQRRGGIVGIRQELEGVIPPDSDRSERGESLRADYARVLATLDSDEYTSAHGLVIVACNAAGVYEVLPLAFPVENNVIVGPEPGLADLARYSEDYPSYAVLLLDQKSASLMTFVQGRPRRSLNVRGTGYPRKQQQGGWSQRRYQMRADERTEAFVRGVAEETRRVLDETGVKMLILAGNDQITSAVRNELHESIQQFIIGTVNLPIEASPTDIVEVVQPIVNQVERDREAAAVQAVRDGVGTGTGAGGAADVLRALEAGQVQMLVMNDDFQAEGWTDLVLGLYGVGPKPTTHPMGGNVDDILSLPLDQTFVRLALQTDAEIEIVASNVPVSEEEQTEIRDPETTDMPRSEPAKALDEFGGVGATFRFVIGAESQDASANA